MKDHRRHLLTFCFTDIEGSTGLARELSDDYPNLLEAYQIAVRHGVNNHFGLVVDSAGDGFFITFRNPLQAIESVIEIQDKINAIRLPGGRKLEVRIGLHTGTAMSSNGGYTGVEVHKASRICDAAHGGQVLISNATMKHIKSQIPKGHELAKLGKFLLKDFEEPENLYQLSKAGTSKFPTPRAIPALPVIAVLPFCRPGVDPDLEFLCEGVTTDIIHAFARMPGIRVIPHTITSSLRDKIHQPAKTGAALNANFVLSGKISRQKQMIKLSVQLTDVDLDQIIWSTDYNRNAQDLLVIEDEIAAEVAKQLNISQIDIKKIQQTQTENIEAYDFYIKGRKFYYQYSKQSTLFALQMFQNAIRNDPNYALAYAGIADCYSYLYMYDSPTEVNLQAVEKYSRKAIELGPDLAEAFASRGFALSLQKNYQEAEAVFEKAISLDPQLFEAYYLYARVAYAAGKMDKAAGLFRDANRVRPEDYQSLLLAGQCFEATGLLERAKEMREEGVEIAEKQLKLNPGDIRALYMGANGLMGLGEQDKAINWLQRALTLESKDPMLLYNAGCIYAKANMPEQAIECLERSFSEGLTQIDWYLHDTDLDNIRNTNRFKSLIQKLQLISSS